MTDSGEIDLEQGDPRYADDSPAAARRARRKNANDVKAKKPPSRGSASDKLDTEIQSRLERAFERIAEWREARGDDELAEIIREDGPAMAQGGVAATRGVPVLRGPVIMFLNLLEPILAFNRTGRVLIGRLLERRMRGQEQDDQQAQWEQQQSVTPVVPIG